MILNRSGSFYLTKSLQNIIFNKNTLIDMDIKQMSVQDLESYFNLTCKIRDGIIMMARANNNMNTKQVRNINDRYNILLKEIMFRLDGLYEGNITKKEMLNEEVVH